MSVVMIWTFPLAEILANQDQRAELVRTYSELFEKGRPCRSCNSACENYYHRLKREGMARYELVEKAKNRTCKPAFKGLFWVDALAMHIDSELVNDEQAIQMLRAGHLSTEMFSVLPYGYSTDSDSEKTDELQALETPETPEELAKPKATKQRAKDTTNE